MKSFMVEECYDPDERAVQIQVNGTSIWMSDYEAAITAGRLAAQREVEKAFRLYQQERLECGCVDCLSQLGLKVLDGR